MTYEESFMSCKTFEELQAKVKEDAKIALFCGSRDRMAVIEKVANVVCKAKGWDKEQKEEPTNETV